MAKVEPAWEKGERGGRERSSRPGGGGLLEKRASYRGILSRALTWSLVFSRASISLLVLFWTFHWLLRYFPFSQWPL